jgi:2,4-didehydro-3-deoxy-L-rhamnonate hydrolase
VKFLRFGAPGEERPGVLDANGRIRDLSDMMSDLAGPNLARLGRVDPDAFPVVEGAPRLGPPVAGVGKIVWVGRLPPDDPAGAGGATAEPALALKATSALAGPTDAVVLPRGAEGLDWDMALAVVIGRTARSVREEEALTHVAGYAVFNGLTERAVPAGRGGTQAHGGRGDGIRPLGPWLVTPDELGDPQRLAVELTVNGETMSRGSTADMGLPVAWLLSHASAAMTLDPGDIVAAGTPGGMETGRPPRTLGPGDVVEAWIEGLGRQRQAVAAG